MIPFTSGTATRARFASVVFDVDSTLSAIEGIDWLAEHRGHAVAHECAALTAQAMSGDVAIEEVYLKRLRAIAPTATELGALAEAYLNTIQPGAPEVIAALHDAEVEVHLVSGGLHDAIIPMAFELGIPVHRVHAVHIAPDANGKLVELDGMQPLATQRGKPLVVSRLGLARPSVMIGDGATDAAARGVVDEFIAYTGVARRDAVVAVADAEASDFLSLHRLLFVAPR